MEGKELKARVAVMVAGLRTRLPPDYVEAVDILAASLGEELAEGEGMFDKGWYLMPVAGYVEGHPAAASRSRGLLALLRQSGDATSAHFLAPPLSRRRLSVPRHSGRRARRRWRGSEVPWFVTRLHARRRFNGAVVAWVRCHETGSPDLIRGSAVICSQQGEVLVRLDGITLKRGAVARLAPRRPAVEPAGPSRGGDLVPLRWRICRNR